MFFYLSAFSYAHAHTLKITTWNLDWLTLRNLYNSDLPSNIPYRSDADFARLHHYAQKLDSDLIALQEIDGTDTARHVFDPQKYNILTTYYPIIQRVGLAIRRTIPFSRHPDLIELDADHPHAKHHLRSGLDVTIYENNIPLRLLVVHLKAGCWARLLDEKKYSCPTLYQQFQIIDNWIANRQKEGTPFIILGDFNRQLTFADPLMQILQDSARLTLPTAGYASPCHGGRHFIDHLILGNDARNWLIPDSLRVMTYHDDKTTSHLSDHCPVSLKLHIP